ncbi:MAG: aspartate dehydrogenase [Clostridia bacterium]|nr:aspartate dehydrogenase [Clostridia bacterium]
MSTFGWSKPKSAQFDLNLYQPLIRSSICTGEKVAGFKEKATGKFVEVALICTPKDLQDFRDRYGIQGNIETIY